MYLGLVFKCLQVKWHFLLETKWQILLSLNYSLHFIKMERGEGFNFESTLKCFLPQFFSTILQIPFMRNPLMHSQKQPFLYLLSKGNISLSVRINQLFLTPSCWNCEGWAWICSSLCCSVPWVTPEHGQARSFPQSDKPGQKLQAKVCAVLKLGLDF